MNLSAKMSASLPKDLMVLIKKVSGIADSLRCRTFMVGGAVRDLLLGSSNSDMDIAIEGDAIALGKLISKELKCRIVAYERFGTCTVFTKKGIKLDLATARKEIYESPAMLPIVSPSSIEDDLWRRDFAINAMAVSLNKENFGEIIDPAGGMTDMRSGRIRVLHEKSFIDDPTRILRAARFEARLGFRIDRSTINLIRKASKDKMLERVGCERVRDELFLIMEEERPFDCLKRAEELYGLGFIHKSLRADKDMARLFNSVEKSCRWFALSDCRKRPLEKWAVYLMALFEPLNYNEVSLIADKYGLRRSDKLRLLVHKKRGPWISRLLNSPSDVAPSSVFSILDGLSLESVLLIYAKTPPGLTRSRIKRFIEEYGCAKISITGSDIKAMGLTPGPHYKHVLARVLSRKIDGLLPTKRDELKYLNSLINPFDAPRAKARGFAQD